MDPHQFQTLWRACDREGKGFLNRDEWTSFIIALLSPTSTITGRLNDHDMLATSPESVAHYVTVMWDEADANGDGALSPAEVSWWLQHRFHSTYPEGHPEAEWSDDVDTVDGVRHGDGDDGDDNEHHSECAADRKNKKAAKKRAKKQSSHSKKAKKHRRSKKRKKKAKKALVVTAQVVASVALIAVAIAIAVGGS
eukprot:TRINITY_DN14738_c0_g1_i1.p1 TRINITY_DN14738_c0_g1~~TRINITY_DN14738_c0_g1_i1.p1  ORF type:complete len:195 (-),score=57.78 TRINITY_DN14738_c0_g1_i1:81-665(-)